MKIKGYLKFLSLVVALIMILGACAAPATMTAPTATKAPEETPTEVAPTAAATSEPQSAEAVKVTVFVGFGTGGEPSQIEVHNQLAKEFNDSHTNIQVEFLTIPFDNHNSEFTSMLADGMAPDLVMPIGVGGVVSYNDEWLDISPYIKRDNYDTSDYYGPSLKLQTYPDKLVGLPIGVYPSAIFYNADLFDKAGLEYPPHQFGDPDWTYDKMIDLAKKLTVDLDGKTAEDQTFDPWNIKQWGWAGWERSSFRVVPAKFGGSALGVSADYKTAQMNTGAYLEGMQFIHDSIWVHHVRPMAAMANSLFGDVDPLQSGKVAMWETFSWMAYNYSTWTEAFNWDMAAIPAGPKGDIVAETSGDTFAIPKSSKHPDEAWEVAKWFMQPENLSRLAKSYGCIPARKSLADNWLDDMKSEYPHVDFQVMLDSIDYMDAQPNNEGWVPNNLKVLDATEAAMQKVGSGQDKNVQEVMDALNKEVQGYLDEYWSSH